jgi:NAD(P)-dependent dehydrogenase (short-subunit alcohol dehydrogenase family)
MLAAADMAVVAVDPSAQAADATVSAFVKSRGKAIPAIVNLGQPAGVETAIAAAMAEFDRIDVLVNNAGIYRPAGALPDIDRGLFERT